MKTQFKTLIISFLSITLLMNCEDAQVTPKEYPYPVMKEVKTSISGAKFLANVSSLGNQTILSHGFVWGTRSTPNIEVDDRKYIVSELTTGSMVTEINSGLINGQTYYVRPFIQTESLIVYGSEISFISEGSNPPEIHDFQPRFGSAGTLVEITGKNFGFSSTSNSVRFGNYVADVDSFTTTKLYVKVPQVTERGEAYISIETAGMSVKSTDKFDLYFPWLKLNATYYSNGASTSFTIAENAYIINADKSSGLRFNPSNEKGYYFRLPENAGPYPKAFSISNKGYVLLENGFYEYDPANNIWTQKADFPENIANRRYAFAMNFDHIGLIGFCYKNQKLWAYNPNSDTWIRKADFPEDFTQTNYPVYGKFSFSIKNKGYLGVSQSTSMINTFWEYDVNLNVWSEKSPLPTYAYASFASMVIDGAAYAGLGRTFNWGDGYVSNQIWKYDQSNDNWIPYQNCPVRLGVTTSFGIGNKGYILSRYTEYMNTVREIWEFDPREN